MSHFRQFFCDYERHGSCFLQSVNHYMRNHLMNDIIIIIITEIFSVA